MRHRIDRLAHQFVTYVPEILDEGVLYISMQYRVSAHLCCCGCRERVVTPLGPAQWVMTFDGATISLRPSIAAGRCNSHYVIRGGSVHWLRPLTEHERDIATREDLLASTQSYGGAGKKAEEVASRSMARGARGWCCILDRLRLRR